MLLLCGTSAQDTPNTSVFQRKSIMSMRGIVSSLLRQQAHATRRSFVVASAQQHRVGNPMDHGGSSAFVVPPRPIVASMAAVNSVCCGQQARMTTIRGGVTGPLSARVRLPMRGLEEFRDPEIIKVGLRRCLKTSAGVVDQSRLFLFVVRRCTTCVS